MFLLLILFTMSVMAQNKSKIKPTSSFKTEVTEPSDICINPLNTDNFYIVSDNGYLYETDKEGKILRTANFYGIDTEAVFAKDDKVYVVQEFSRKITVLDAKNLEVIKNKRVDYGGGRNKAFEAFTFNEAKNVFIVITEKDPIVLFELDENLNVVNELDLKTIARDISAATYHDNFLYLLSDEDRTVFKLDPTSYKILEEMIVPIINPEGIAFDKNNNLVIASDDLKKIFYFNLLAK